MVQIRRTDGDFPHTRKRSVTLACACSTCCCFTLLGAGIGGIAGFVTGIVQTARYEAQPRSAVMSVVTGIGRLAFFCVGYGVLGLLSGAAVGFAVDFLVGTMR